MKVRVYPGSGDAGTFDKSIPFNLQQNDDGRGRLWYDGFITDAPAAGKKFYRNSKLSIPNWVCYKFLEF